MNFIQLENCMSHRKLQTNKIKAIPSFIQQNIEMKDEWKNVWFFDNFIQYF